jgi:glycosyltransferase involved in cell wall biosynthesis
MKKLSIVTINYNNADGLEKTLNSIHPIPREINEFVEHIVIDGGSTDESLAKIDLFRQEISAWVSERDAGIFNAMNKGLDRCTGEFIIFMNSGDCFVQNTLSKELLKDLENCEIFYGDYYSYKLGQTKLIKQTKELDFLYFIGKTICHQSVFIKKSILQKYRFTEDEKYSLMGDWIQLFSILRNENPKIKYKPSPICYYDVLGQSDQFKEKRLSQRETFLLTFYSNWELKQLVELHRLRNRSYYQFIMHSLNKYSLGKMLSILSKLLCR